MTAVQASPRVHNERYRMAELLYMGGGIFCLDAVQIDSKRETNHLKSTHSYRRLTPGVHTTAGIGVPAAKALTISNCGSKRTLMMLFPERWYHRLSG